MKLKVSAILSHSHYTTIAQNAKVYGTIMHHIYIYMTHVWFDCLFGLGSVDRRMMGGGYVADDNKSLIKSLMKRMNKLDEEKKQTNR